MAVKSGRTEESLRRKGGESGGPKEGRGFGPYKLQEESASGKMKVAPDRRVDAMRKVLRDVIGFHKSLGLPDTVMLGAPVLKALCYPFISDLKYGKNDIRKFILQVRDVHEFGNWHGVFINALISMRGMERYELDFCHLEGLSASVGAGSRGVLRVRGDVGFECGMGMEDGLLIVEGNVNEDAGAIMRGGAMWIKGSVRGPELGMRARGVIIVDGETADAAGSWMEECLMVLKKGAGNYPGSHMKSGVMVAFGDAGQSVGCGMDGGLIRICGNAGKLAGEHTKGGTIIIEGNAGPDLGRNMDGGEIHVNGEIESIGDIQKGRVYHRGKMVVEVR